LGIAKTLEIFLSVSGESLEHPKGAGDTASGSTSVAFSNFQSRCTASLLTLHAGPVHPPLYDAEPVGWGRDHQPVSCPECPRPTIEEGDQTEEAFVQVAQPLFSWWSKEKDHSNNAKNEQIIKGSMPSHLSTATS